MSIFSVGPFGMPEVVNCRWRLSQFDGELHVFAPQVSKDITETSRVAAWVRKALDKANTNRIADRDKNDRNG
jgi:hypothetical protein